MKYDTTKKLLAELSAYVKKVEKGNSQTIEVFEFESGNDIISCVVHRMNRQVYLDKKSQMVGGNIPTKLDSIKEWCKLIYYITTHSNSIIIKEESSEDDPEVGTVTTLDNEII